MSTKVYEFYKYTGKDIFSLYKWLESLRIKHYKWQIEQIRSFMSLPSDQKERRAMRFDIEKRIRETTQQGYRDPFNIESSVMIYLYKNNLYLQFFGVDRKFIRHNRYLKDAHYQNQTDQPSGISDKEWSEREDVVDGIFKGAGIPSNCGLVFKLLDSHDDYYVAKDVVMVDELTNL